MARSFWKLQYQINYQSESDEGLYGEDYGFGEKVFLDEALSAPDAAARCRNILAARAACLARDCKIVNVALGRGDQVRSRYDLGSYAQNPVIMAEDGAVVAAQELNVIDDALLLRFQTDAGRRWTRQLRAVRDTWIQDQTEIFNGNLFGTGVGADSPYPAIQTVPDPATITEATFTVTNTNGVLSLPIIATAGSYPLAQAGTYPLVITDAGNQGRDGAGTFTIAGGVVTAVAITSVGFNYVNPVLSAPGRSDVNGLANYQLQTDYFRNLQSILSQQAINFHPAKVANALFPSGFETIIDPNPPYNGNFYVAACSCIERASNRQTGRIWTKRKARHKVGI